MLFEFLVPVIPLDLQSLRPWAFLSTLFILCLLVLAGSVSSSTTSALDLLNQKQIFEITSVRVKREFLEDAFRIITNRSKAIPGKSFRVIADVGEVTIIAPEYAHEIRNDERFSFTKAAFQVGSKHWF